MVIFEKLYKEHHFPTDIYH